MEHVPVPVEEVALGGCVSKVRESGKGGGGGGG